MFLALFPVAQSLWQEGVPKNKNKNPGPIDFLSAVILKKTIEI